MDFFEGDEDEIDDTEYKSDDDDEIDSTEDEGNDDDTTGTGGNLLNFLLWYIETGEGNNSTRKEG